MLEVGLFDLKDEFRAGHAAHPPQGLRGRSDVTFSIFPIFHLSSFQPGINRLPAFGAATVWERGKHSPLPDGRGPEPLAYRMSCGIASVAEHGTIKMRLRCR